MLRWLICACLLLAACDGVGRALVDRGPGEGGDGPGCPIMECRPTGFLPLMPLDPYGPTDRCTEPSPAQCEPANETEPGLDPAAAGACRHVYSLDDDEVDLDALRGLACGNVRLVRTQPEPASFRIEDANWIDLDLEIESASALTLEVARPFLTQTRLRIIGPVTVRVLETRALHDVVVMSESAAAAIDVTDAAAQAIRLGDEGDEFAARITMTRSTLERVQIFARDLSFETVGLSQARVTAENLHWVDVTSRGVKLAVGTAVISASRLSEVEVLSCDVLDIHRSSLSAYAIPACSVDPTRLFESTLTRGTLDGTFDADNAQIVNSVFGANDATDLLLWDTRLSVVNFCAGTNHVVLAGKSATGCSRCQELDGSQVPIDACREPNNDKLVVSSFCELLYLAPDCDPAPERMRPPFN